VILSPGFTGPTPSGVPVWITSPVGQHGGLLDVFPEIPRPLLGRLPIDRDTHFFRVSFVVPYDAEDSTDRDTFRPATDWQR